VSVDCREVQRRPSVLPKGPTSRQSARKLPFSIPLICTGYHRNRRCSAAHPCCETTPFSQKRNPSHLKNETLFISKTKTLLISDTETLPSHLRNEPCLSAAKAPSPKRTPLNLKRAFERLTIRPPVLRKRLRERDCYKWLPHACTSKTDTLLKFETFVCTAKDWP
jgi:hypothetical protein